MVVIFIVVSLALAFAAIRLSSRPLTRECARGCGKIVTWSSGFDAFLNGWCCRACRGETNPHRFPGYDWEDDEPDR